MDAYSVGFPSTCGSNLGWAGCLQDWQRIEARPSLGSDHQASKSTGPDLKVPFQKNLVELHSPGLESQPPTLAVAAKGTAHQSQTIGRCMGKDGVEVCIDLFNTYVTSGPHQWPEMLSIMPM